MLIRRLTKRFPLLPLVTVADEKNQVRWRIQPSLPFAPAPAAFQTSVQQHMADFLTESSAILSPFLLVPTGRDVFPTRLPAQRV